MKKKWLSLLMVITMLFSMCLPTAVFAAAAPNDDGVTVETTLQDNLQQRGSKKTIDVIARAGDKKIDTRVYLNDDPVEVAWSDSNKDSYTLNFTKEGENTVLIQGIDGDYVKEITRTVYYKKAAPGEAIGHATFSLEGVTIGAGYFIEPIKVEIHEGENAAQVLTRVLKEHGYSYAYTGNVENSFYLSSVGNGGLYEDGCQEKNTLMRKAPVDLTGKVPKILQTVMDDQGAMIYENDLVDSEGFSNELGEFCYTYMSGWMYSINNVFPNVGFSGSYLGDGDVVRVQFTLYGYGADIGGGYSMGGENTDYYVVANKTDLVKNIAEVNSRSDKAALLADPTLKAAYDKAVELAIQLDAPQAEVDSAVKSLDFAIKAYEKNAADKKAAAEVDAKIDAIGEVTHESKEVIEAARKAYDALTADQQKHVTKLDKLTKAEAELKDILSKPIGSVYISVDKATLGQGYLVEPVKVPFFAGENAAQVLNRALEMNGFKLDYTGSLEDSFYMSAITNAGGNLKAEFPAYLQNYIKENKVAVSNPRDGESLGEFDYTSYSGWVFKYDNIHSPVGASGVECKDGMTFRWAFTVCGLGSDCWDTGWGNPIVPYAVNKDALIKKVADFKVRADYEELMKTKTMKDAYAAILKVGTDNEIDQVAIDQAIADFERAIKFELMYIEEAAEVDAKIAAIGEVTLESESAITDARIAYATLSEGAQARVTKLADLEAAEKKLADLKTAEDKKAAAAVDAKIDAIGTVTLGSKAAIEEARSAYEALTADQQKHVTKLSALESAEKKYAELKAEADKLAADKKAAAAVDSKIDAIGDVTLDSKAAIDEARAAYEALTADQQKHVTKLSALESAEKKYAELKAEADKLAADKKAAAAVDSKIDAIGDVTLDSKAAIDEARAAYDALTADQQKHVTKLPALEEAEKKYAELKAEADKLAADKKAAAEVDAKIDAIGDVTLDSIDKINAATDAYNKLTDDQKAHVTGLDKLNAAVEKYNELKAEADKPAAKPEEDKTPSTGDENAVLLYGLAMLAAAGTAYAARRKYNR